MLTCTNASGTRAFLDAYGCIINGTIAKPLTAIRFQWWWQRRIQHMCHQALYRFARERLPDEAMQGEIGNLLVGETCKQHCLQDLQIWQLNEGLDDLFELVWINRS
jgi:hypothetical protein